MLHFPKKENGAAIENDFQNYGDKKVIIAEMKAARKETDEYHEKIKNDQDMSGNEK